MISAALSTVIAAKDRDGVELASGEGSDVGDDFAGAAVVEVGAASVELISDSGLEQLIRQPIKITANTA